MENFNTLTILTKSVSKLRSLAEERLGKLYGYERLWSNIEEVTRVSRLFYNNVQNTPEELSFRSWNYWIQ